MRVHISALPRAGLGAVALLALCLSGTEQASLTHAAAGYTFTLHAPSAVMVGKSFSFQLLARSWPSPVSVRYSLQSPHYHLSGTMRRSSSGGQYAASITLRPLHSPLLTVERATLTITLTYGQHPVHHDTKQVTITISPQKTNNPPPNNQQGQNGLPIAALPPNTTFREPVGTSATYPKAKGTVSAPVPIPTAMPHPGGGGTYRDPTAAAPAQSAPPAAPAPATLPATGGGEQVEGRPLPLSLALSLWALALILAAGAMFRLLLRSRADRP